MNKLLVVIDMQNDFIHGPLGTDEAKAILPRVVKKVASHAAAGGDVLFTMDTHDENYLDTTEGKHLPVMHCIKGTEGWMLPKELDDLAKETGARIFEKPTFGSLPCCQFVASLNYDEVELVGLCTDICVVSNALILKSVAPDLPILVDPLCCAGVTRQSHLSALETMKMCQVKI